MKYFLLLAVFAIAACAQKQTLPQNSGSDQFTHYPFGVRPKAIRGRQPATSATIASDVGVGLSALRMISPKKFEVYVYPKLNSQNVKTQIEDVTVLGKPQVFEVSPIAVLSCRELIKGEQFKKFKPNEFFDINLAQDPKSQCAIVELTDQHLKNKSRDLIRNGDVLSVRLFIDDQYKTHGYEIDKFVDSQNMKLYRIKKDPLYPMTSELGLFPVDMPTDWSLYEGSPISKQFGSNKEFGLDNLSIRQAQRFNRTFRVTNCAGYQYEFENYYGSPTRVSWCKGIPWPLHSENARFVSVTQPLSVR